MKRIIALLICLLCALPAFADSAPSAAALKFSPAGGGTFIYCNNRESVTADMLSDKSNPKPQYIMNNPDLTAGKYSLYVSLLNHTETKNAEGRITKTGFDIEADAYLRAKTDTVLKITAAGFEVPSISETYANGALSRNEGDWSCIKAIADYTGREIKSVRGEGAYTPDPIDEITVTLKRGEVTWLSKYLKNYTAASWLKPIHILCDFEIQSGSIDLNIAALKSDGAVGDRSRHDENAAFGKYVRDRQYKGIADTLPCMYSDKLSYIIDDTVRDGTELPVTVYNQYKPSGNTLTHWFTHLNPLEDIWSREQCTQSDMIELYYNDPSKLANYGALVPSSKKSRTWYFDVYHSDLTSYGGDDKKGAANFRPNDTLSAKNENTGSACNLGNYGVFVNYHVEIKNNGNADRYFNYRLRTTANNVVSLKNADGTYALPYSVYKGQTDEKRTDTMASLVLPAGETTEFYIEVLLPMNNPGGMENSFMITDGAPKTYEDKADGSTTLSEDNFTGKEYYRWTADSIITHTNGGERTYPLTEKTKKAFEGNHTSYKITAAGSGYIARFSAFQPNPSYYSDMLKYYKKMYILDNTFNVVSVSEFPAFVSDASYANGVYYAKSDKIYYSADGNNWTEAKSVPAVPVSNGGGISYAADGEKYYLSSQPDGFMPIKYNGEKPEFIEVFGDYYCYASGNTLYASKDGMYYTKQEFPETVKTAAYIDGQLMVNGKYTFSENVTKKRIVTVNGTAYKFKTVPVGEKLPLKEVMEALNARVMWDDSANAVTVAYNGKSYVFPENGGEITVTNGASFITCDNLARIFGVKVSADENIITVTGDSDTVIESEYYGGFEVPEITAQTAVNMAKALGMQGELTAELNENSGYWEIKNGDETVMAIKKSDGKIIVKKGQ